MSSPPVVTGWPQPAHLHGGEAQRREQVGKRRHADLGLHEDVELVGRDALDRRDVAAAQRDEALAKPAAMRRVKSSAIGRGVVDEALEAARDRAP